MMKKRNIIGLICCGVIICVGIASVWWLYLQFRQRVIIHNTSDMMISRIDVMYARKSLTIHGLAPGATVKKTIRAERDGAFDVAVTFADGETAEIHNMDYITPGQGWDYTFVITPAREITPWSKHIDGMGIHRNDAA